MPEPTAATLAQRRPLNARYVFHGPVEQRMQANLEQWLLVAPQANSAMLEMMRDRDRLPRRDLMPWAGEFAGKYLTSAVLCWRLGRDGRLRRQIDRFVDELVATQAADGYMGPAPQHERYTGRTADGKHALWDLWGHYHCMLGLLLWYGEVGYAPALEACRRTADAICRRFLDTGESLLQAGAEEMNMAVAHGLALLYQETGEARYLDMVRQIEADWRVPPAGDYVESALRGVPFYLSPKPRWESLHDIQAVLSLYEITGEARYRQAFEHTWRSILHGDRHNSGGFSSGEAATGNPYDPRPIETCCTVAWMALSVDMLRLTGDARVADELELSTLNGAIGSQSPTGRWWTYNTPMDGVRRSSAHDIVFQAREGSPELNCCSVNGPRALGMLSEWAVMEDDTGPVLNYYGPGTFTVPLAEDGRVRLTQRTAYPLDGRIEITVEPDAPRPFALRLRVPGWSAHSQAWLNGAPIEGVRAGRYLALEREWRTGDVVTLELDMSLRAWHGEREAQGKVSLYRGPLLLAYDRRYNSMDPDQIPAPALSGDESQIVPWAGATPAPWLLLSVPTVVGRPLLLCDFATAGMAGTPYVTWLPAS